MTVNKLRRQFAVLTASDLDTTDAQLESSCTRVERHRRRSSAERLAAYRDILIRKRTAQKRSKLNEVKYANKQ